MKLLSIDVECTTSNKGNPFDTTNSLVSIGFTDGTTSKCVRADDYGRHFVQRAIENADMLVGFNIKFDINWLRRFGIEVNKRVFDCQLAEFILHRQRLKYPNLAGCLERYELGSKLDVVKEEYWKKGIDTDQIPWEILSQYNIVDAEQTLKLYHKQMEVLKPQQWRLVHLCCADLMTLQEMEFNGFPVDLTACETESRVYREKIEGITTSLATKYPHVPINFNSVDHLSAYLYGGEIEEKTRVLAGAFRTGAKIGEPRYTINREVHTLAGIVKPIKGTELKKPGLYATNEDTLRKLKDKTGTIDKLLEVASLTKVNEFFEGFININRELHWPANKIHGQFNQVSTATGRLSSTKPNLQNMCPEIQNFVRSEYGQT